MQSITGFSAEEFKKINLADTYVNREDREILLKKIEEFGIVFDYPVKLKRKDGTIYDAMLSISRVNFCGREVVQTICTDITEQKRAYEAFIESEDRFAKAFRSSPDAMSISRLSDGCYLEVNDSFTRITGYTYNEIIGRSSIDLSFWVKPDDRDKVVDTLEKQGRVRDMDVDFRMKSGEVHTGLISAEIINLGSERCILAVVRDITERKQAREKLRESEERFFKAFHSSPNAISFTRLSDGEFIDVNESFLKFSGYKREELIGQSSLEMSIWSEPMVRQQTLQLLQEDKKIQNVERKFRVKTGERRVGLVSIDVIRVGEEPCLLTTIQDITERKQAEELYTTLATSSPVGVYIAQDHKFVFVNPEFQKATGFSEDELVGRDPLSIAHPEDRERVRRNAVEMLKGNHIPAYELRAIVKDGKVRWALETVTSVTYKGRRATLGNFIDITELKQVEEKDRRLQQELNRSARLASVGELAAGVAHEINNPLTGILGFSERLLRKSPSDTISHDMEKIHSEARRAAKVVQNLLTFARQRESRKQPCDINDVLQRALELRAYELKADNIEVITDLSPDLPSTTADFQQLQEVFLNLILNAEQAMVETSGHGRLLIKTDLTNGNIGISFTDDGPGILPEYLEKLFTPFFTTRSERGGTGLGLSICHGIVTEHGGQIYARNNPDKGATFLVQLPVAFNEQMQQDSARSS
jgi:PAS domain S-box-containing protein